ncbi:MAG: hypothetical protein ACSHX9_09640 [Luteolibacter sp.]
MEQPPALTPEQLAVAQAANQSQVGEPQTVKIFGILHLVFAAFGAMGIAWALLTAVTGNPFASFGPQTPEMAAQAEMQAQMQDKLMPMTLIANGIGILVTILMVTAGIKLLKKKKDALKWSNRYAYLSIFAKVVGLVMMFTYMIPVMKEFFDSQNLPGPVSRIMMPVMIGSAFIGLVIGTIYPVLALVLLNRPATKDWFANRPE